MNQRRLGKNGPMVSAVPLPPFFQLIMFHISPGWTLTMFCGTVFADGRQWWCAGKFFRTRFCSASTWR